MSAPAVAIGRLSATFHAPAASAPSDGRVHSLLGRVADGRLEQALLGTRLPPGRWCVRRLALTVSLDLGRSDRALADVWAEAVATAIERTVRERRGDVVHYRHEVELLAELVAAVATGRTERAWAWAQAGALLADDPSPASAPGAAILAASGRRPQYAAAALLRAAEVCGLPALDRALGRAGWQQLAGLVAVAGRPAPGPESEPVGAADTPASGSAVLAAMLLRGSRWAGLVRAAGLRPGEATLAAWAVLVAAEADPASLYRRPHPGLTGALVGELRELLGVRPRGEASERALPPDDPTPPRSEAAADPAPEVLPPRGRPEPEPECGGASPAYQEELRASAAEARPEGVATEWAGLPFVLAVAAEAGLPQRVLDEPVFAARPLRWVLYETGLALLPGLAADDPALRALTGARPSATAGPATAEERTGVRELARAWAAAAAARLLAGAVEPPGGLRADGDPLEAVAWLARRPGRVLAEPGWIEVQLALAGADTAVRRAGLDLDPGWVPWIGAVVRYVYV